MRVKTVKKGRLEVICGSMFSGKTEELIRRLRRAQIAQLKTQVFKHSLDNQRSPTVQLHSHGGDSLAAMAVDTTASLQQLVLDDSYLIGIDEVQFFSSEICLAIQEFIEKGKHVIVAGLDLDFRGLPFGCMPALLALADDVTKLKAVCIMCGDNAHFTQRMVNGRPAKYNDPIVMVGAMERYQARCRGCYKTAEKPLGVELS